MFIFTSILFLFACSFLMAAAESSFFTLKNWKISKLKKINNASFRILVNNSESLISTLSLGTTTSNCLIISIFILNFSKYETVYFMLLSVFLLFFIALFCEILPKTLAIKSPEKWARNLSNPIIVFHYALMPIRTLAEIFCNISSRLFLPKTLIPNTTTSEEEFGELIDWAYQQGVLERSEREIMEEIIKLDKRTAEEAMKPRANMVCIEDNLPIKEMLSDAKKHKYTRLPIFNETTDNIVGILNTRQLLLQPDGDLSESIEFPSFVPSTMNLMDLLHSLQRQRRGLAIVLDEFGGTAGLITIEDILEELVGEMREEGEKVEFTIEKLNRNRWRVNGSLSVEDFAKLVPELKRLPEVDTMGGLVVALKEVVPKNGESIKYRGLELTVVAADDRRVKELIIKKTGKQ